VKNYKVPTNKIFYRGANSASGFCHSQGACTGSTSYSGNPFSTADLEGKLSFVC